jgi:hypothetical protein
METRGRPGKGTMRIPRNVAIFVAGALVALACLVVIRSLREGPTDEEQIRAIFEEGARAVEEKRPADAMAGVSERFQGEGMAYRELKQFITYQALRGSWNAVVPVAEKVEVTGDRAEAVLEVVLARGGKGTGVLGRLPENGDVWRVEASLAREKGGWKVVSARWSPTGRR